MSTLESYLTTIADAIREKKGTTEPIKAKNFASEILSIQGGGSLNVAYSLTPPTDTSKIWLQCAEPQAVEVQNYLGECAVSNVANWGTIDNPVDGDSKFYCGYYPSCYIGNNQIAIVGYNHIRIYDLTSKSYIADYTISVGINDSYSNVIYKDNILYFGYGYQFYSFDLETQILKSLGIPNWNSSYSRYISFGSNNNIFYAFYANSSTSYVYKYDIKTSEYTTLWTFSEKYFDTINKFDNNKILINNTFYNFFYYIENGNKYDFKFNLLNGKFSDFTSLENFANSQGWTQYRRQSLVYDGERYVYLIGGSIIKSGETNITPLNDIVRYDAINDTFERLGVSLLGAKRNHFSLLIDNRAYIFGGDITDGFTRPNQIDYFDISYPLPQNNAIITTNTINTDH